MNKERAFHEADFCMDLSAERFSGYTDGDTWNGFACPYFPFDEAVRLLEHFGNRWKYDEPANAFTVWALGSEDNEPEVFAGIRILVGNRDLEVYAIGAYSWIWGTCE